MSKDQGQKVAMLEEQARKSNEAMSEKLSALLYEVQPQTQIDYLKENLSYRARLLRYECMTTIDEARAGNPEAREKLLKVAAIGAAIIGVLVLRSGLKRKRKNK